MDTTITDTTKVVAPIDPKIEAGLIGNTTGITVPPAQEPTNLLAGLASTTQQTADQSTAKESTAQNDFTNLLKQLEGQTTDIISAENQQNLPGLNKELLDLQKVANKQTAEYIAGYAGQEAKRNTRQETTVAQQNLTRQNAVDALLTNSLISAKQGDITFANSLVDRAIKAKYDPLKARIETQKEILRQVEGKASQDRQTALNLQLKKIDQQAKDQTEIYTSIVNAQAAGAPKEVIDAASKATTPLEAAKILGKYSPETLKYEMLKEQIKTEKAQQANIYNTIKNRDADTTRQDATANGGKPPTDAQVQNAGYADRIQQANTIIDSKADTFKNLNYAQFKLLESNGQAANSLLTPDQRQAAQAMRNFITAKLRKESGASISPTEFADARVQYFPALNDDPQTLANKKVLRDSVLKNNILGAGSAYSPTLITQSTQQDNPFSKAIGQTGNQVVQGTSIISGLKNGKLDFNIPTK